MRSSASDPAVRMALAGFIRRSSILLWKDSFQLRRLHHSTSHRKCQQIHGNLLFFGRVWQFSPGKSGLVQAVFSIFRPPYRWRKSMAGRTLAFPSGMMQIKGKWSFTALSAYTSTLFFPKEYLPSAFPSVKIPPGLQGSPGGTVFS